MNKGKLVVIEGLDGAGKTTQLELAIAEFKKQGIPLATFDFPQYEKTFFGKFVGRFLKGEFGMLSEINPYLASFPYAFDRWQVKDQIIKALDEGSIVFCNRFTSSNLAHQTAKLPEFKRCSYLTWLKQLEYEILGLPKEDLVIFLDVPAKIAFELIDKKKDRSYLDGKRKDIAESDFAYQVESGKIYTMLAKTEPNWVRVECVQDEQLKSVEEIHGEVMKVIKERIDSIK